MKKTTNGPKSFGCYTRINRSRKQSRLSLLTRLMYFILQISHVHLPWATTGGENTRENRQQVPRGWAGVGGDLCGHTIPVYRYGIEW